MKFYKSRSLFLSAGFLLLSLMICGQPADKISIKKIKWEASIALKDSVIWLKMDNPVNITVKGGTNYTVISQGADIKRRGSRYTVTADSAGAATITVYEQLPDKKMHALCTKYYPVKEMPPAQLFVCGVKADSVIDKQQIIYDDVVTAYHPFYKMDLPVIGFDMLFPLGVTMDTLTSGNNHFTIGMRNRINCLKSGTRLSFINIYYRLPDGSVGKVNAFQVYVSESNKYKVGYRVVGL